MNRKKDCHYNTEVYRKETKLPIYWSSNVPKRYKHNSVEGDFFSKRIYITLSEISQNRLSGKNYKWRN